MKSKTRMEPKHIPTFIADVIMVLEILGIISFSSCSITLIRKDEQPTVRTVL